jgi:excisionase family DNA binding protein
VADTQPSPMLVKVAQAAWLMSISRAKAYALMERGELEYVRIGRSRRVPLSAVRDLIERNRVGGTGR